MSHKVLAFGLDLFFGSKVREECERKGVEFKSLRKVPEENSEAIKDISLFLVNLESEKESLSATLEFVKAQNPELIIVGFCSHINEEAFELAENLGIKEAMPKSQFVKVLPDLISSM